MTTDVYQEDPRVLLRAAVLALLIEFIALTGVGWYHHWLAHPQRTSGLDPSKFIEAEIVHVPPPKEAKLRSEAPVAPLKKEVVLSKVPDKGKKAKDLENKLPDQNQTESGLPPMAPTHGPVSIYAPAPVIPSYLTDREINASVVIEFFITAQSAVTPRLLGSSGNEELDQIALSTVKNWRFRPAEQNHKAVDAKVRLRIIFEVK